MDNKFTFSVVPAKLKDLGALQRLEKECFAQDAWTILDLIGVLTLPDTIRLKAVAGDEMIGFVAGDIRRNEKVGWITTIAVSPKYRQQGVGMALLSICEDQLPFPNIRLSVRRSNLMQSVFTNASVMFRSMCGKSIIQAERTRWFNQKVKAV